MWNLCVNNNNDLSIGNKFFFGRGGRIKSRVRGGVCYQSDRVVSRSNPSSVLIWVLIMTNQGF